MGWFVMGLELSLSDGDWTSGIAVRLAGDQLLDSCLGHAEGIRKGLELLPFASALPDLNSLSVGE